MITEVAKNHDEVQIQQLIINQSNAICTKDVSRIMANYADDVVLFDVKPPFQIKGKEALHQMWENCLPYMPTASGTEKRDLRMMVSGDLAIAHWIFRFTGIEHNHAAAAMWFRVTTSCQRRNDKWQIVHEHLSFPFDPETSQAIVSLEA